MQLDRSINVNPYGLTFLALFALGVVYLTFGSFSFSSHGSGAASSGDVSLKQLLSATIEAAKRGGREVKRVRELVRSES